LQVFRHVLSHTSSNPEKQEYGMTASFMLGEKKVEDSIFLSPKGLAEGRPFSKESGISQLCVSSIFFLHGFFQSVLREPKLTLTDCAFEFKRLV